MAPPYAAFLHAPLPKNGPSNAFGRLEKGLVALAYVWQIKGKGSDNG